MGSSHLLLSMYIISIYAWRRKYNNGYVLEDYSMIPAAICVMLTMLLADLNSQWYMKHDRSNYSQTIRGLSAPKWSQYLMSSAQFHATVHCLLTSERLSVQLQRYQLFNYLHSV